MMRILLAGAAGFVGSALARHLLARGSQVVGVDDFLTGRRENISWVKGGPEGHAFSLVEADVSRSFRVPGRFDAVLHLASPASPIDYLRYPLRTLEAGSFGTRNLLEIARRDAAIFLLASTSEVYGDPLVHPQPESYWGNVNPIGPRSVYDEAKRFSEALASGYSRHAGLRVRIARIFNTYGPRMRCDDGRVIPTFVCQALTGQPVTVFGDGTQTRSYCYVDDLVEGLESLMLSDAEAPVNLGNPVEWTILETARRVIALTNSSSRIVFRPLPQDDPHLRRPDITRARELLGWTPLTSFDEGLARSVSYFEKRLRARARAGSGVIVAETAAAQAWTARQGAMSGDSGRSSVRLAA